MNVHEKPPRENHKGYWARMNWHESQCEQTTWSSVLSNSEVAHLLGDILEDMYSLASCHWGCHGKEHIFEYISGRVVTSTNAAVRLIGFGYYDEALSLSRSIAETGNLLQLFMVDNRHIRLWLDAPDQERRKQYSPVNVRRAIEQLGSVIPTDQTTYSWLCEVGTHATPKTKPQSHNSIDLPILGAMCQPTGVEIALNSLAWSVCTVSGPLAKLALIKSTPAKRIVNRTIRLAEVLFQKPNAPLSK